MLMKKLYILLFAVVTCIAPASAVIHTVTVANNTFTPQTFSASVGDTVRWVLAAGTHTTTATAATIPAGANPWDQMLSSTGVTQFDYPIAVAGNYGYVCSFHTGMVGGFTASSSTNIADVNVSVATTAYPNPFKDKITVTHGPIDAIAIYNMVGEKMSAIEVSATETKTTLELAQLPAGVYFFSTMKEGRVLETKRIVKMR
jgi:plastocyanin